jgi:hypothetical protein
MPPVSEKYSSDISSVGAYDAEGRSLTPSRMRPVNEPT